MNIVAVKAFVIVILSSLTYSCGSDDDILPDQIEAIVKYLEDKDIDYSNVGGTYKYIANIDRYGREELVDSKVGDSLTFNFEAYVFTTSPSSGLYYTNKFELVDAIEGFDPIGWDFNPKKVKIGDNDLMKGINNGLPRCRVGDSIHLYITSDLAYGDKGVGVVKGNSAVLYILNIIDIK